MKRVLILTGTLAFVVGLAFVVARPSVESPAATPFARRRGASLVKSSGLALSLRRGAEVEPLAPGTPVRAGDVLRCVVRAERARHLLVRLRDGAREATTIFPVGDGGLAQASALVQPGDALPVAPVLGPGGGKVVVTALFADRPFPLAEARAADVEEIDAVMEKE